MRQPKPCVVCGREMLVSRCRLERKKYCSRRCRGLSMVAHMNAVRRPAVDNSSWFKKGPRGPQISRLKFLCKNCDREFERLPWMTRRPGFAGIYCSGKCRNSFRQRMESGERSPFWVGGVLTYRGRQWNKIRLVIVKRQRGRCARCKRFVGKSLPVHHVKPYREHQTPEQANHLSNLIGMCQSCHMKTEPRRKRIPSGMPDCGQS